MLNRRHWLAFVASIPLLAMQVSSASSQSGSAPTAAPMQVVASFSILGDLVREVGGEHVAITTLVGPDGDAHVYEPTPQDSRRLGEARLLFENGLDFESWLPRLVKVSPFKGKRVVLSQGIKLLPSTSADDHDHDHDEKEDHDKHDDHAPHEHAHHEHALGKWDPHAWQDIANVLVYVKNIEAALADADPAHAAEYKERAAAYSAKLEALQATLKQRFEAIPADQRRVVTTHSAFRYLGRAFGITFSSLQGLSSEAEPSAADMARIIDSIRIGGIRAVFAENITNTRLLEQISSATGVRIGGRLYSDALAKPGEPAGTYIGLMEWNAGQLITALGQ